MDSIMLAEKLHPVIQGEGKNTNKKMVLVRVFGCPVKCEHCDSQQTWNNKDAEYGIEEFYKLLKKTLKKYNTNHILLTGGEPGIYVDFLHKFFSKYQDKSEWVWEIETSGVYDFSQLCDWEHFIHYNFSPKIGALKPEKDMELIGLNVLPMRYSIKVVTSRDSFNQDLIAIDALKEKYSIEDANIFIMPKGIYKGEIIRESKWLIKKIFKLPYQFTSRQHILIFNNKKLV
jgi:organic radical activating enzyme